MCSGLQNKIDGRALLKVCTNGFSELQGLLKKSYVITGVFAVVMFGMAELLAKPLAGIFVGYDAGLMEMTVRAFTIYSPLESLI